MDGSGETDVLQGVLQSIRPNPVVAEQHAEWTVNGGVGAVGHTTPLALLHVGRGRSDTKGNVTVIAQVPKMAAVAATVRVMNTSTGAVTDLVVQLMVDGLPGILGSLPARAL